jgi:hypothetical protein
LIAPAITLIPGRSKLGLFRARKSLARGLLKRRVMRALLPVLLVAMIGCVADGEIHDGPQDEALDGNDSFLDDDDLVLLPSDEIPAESEPIIVSDPGLISEMPCPAPTFVTGEVRLVTAATELRDAPSPGGKAIAVLPIDAWLTVATSGCGPFVKVVDDQKRAGYVLASKLRMSPCTTPKYPRGAVLYATAAFPLRSAPLATASTVVNVPINTKLVVSQNTCAGAWVRTIDPAAKAGYAPTGNLTSTAPVPSPIADYSATRGKTLADTAIRLWSGKSSGGLCLKGVRTSASTSGIIPSPPGWTPILPSAYEWGLWANAHPTELKARGFRRVTGLGVDKIPRGAIIVWKKGQCGYHSLYGHIEIVTDTASSKACSDYCGSVKKTCGEPWTYIPTVL